MQREQPDQLRRLPEWERSGQIIGAFFEVYNTLGYGFLEAVYRRAMAKELRSRRLAVTCETPIAVQYKGENVGFYRLDPLADERVAVEIKATKVLGPTDERQLLNYLRATTLDVGLLLHFGPDAKVHRVVSPRVISTLPPVTPFASSTSPA